MRVYQMARQLGKPRRALLQLLRELGYSVPSHMAPLVEEQEIRLKEAIERQERGAPAVRPAQASSQSVAADQVAAVVGQIDLAEDKDWEGDAPAGEKKPVRPAAAATAARPAKRKDKVAGRTRHERDEMAENLADEAEREGLEMVSEEPEVDFIGPPLPPDGNLQHHEGMRTIDLAAVEDIGTTPTATTTPARTADERRVTGGRREPREQRSRRRPREKRLVRQKRRGPKVSIQATQQLMITVPISLKDLSQAFGVRAQELIGVLIRETKDFSWNMNSTLDAEQVEMLAEKTGRTVTIGAQKEAEEKFEEFILEQEDAAEGEQEPRPAVVTILGHVDHGKTSLLDKIRSTNVVAGEHGGITQHIGAFQVTTPNGDKVTFLDTPGHAAFTAMRARGAQAADIVVLVVAANDGVMPQTEEAIHHAQAAKVPIVVAVNKCDLREANPDKVKQQLAAHGLSPEEWGGETIMCSVSAITGDGIEGLLESLALTAEISELTANPLVPARGRVIEARKDPARGVICTMLVEEGTLRRGDTVVAGMGMGRVRTMRDDLGANVEVASPSMPVEVFGISEPPDAGDLFYTVKSLKAAKEVISDRREKLRATATPERKQVTLATLFSDEDGPEHKELRLIIKADVRGSLEPLKAEIAKLDHPEISLNLLYAGLGAITRSDVDTAIASNAVVIGFHVLAEPAARKEAERAGVEVRQYTVIYEVIDDLRSAMEQMLAPEKKEEVIGHAEVRAVFASSRLGNIAGSFVIDGVVRRNSFCRLYRAGRLIYGGDRQIPVDSVRRVKDDVKEVREGFECGVRVTGYQDFKEGDVIEFYEIKEIRRTLEGSAADAAAAAAATK